MTSRVSSVQPGAEGITRQQMGVDSKKKGYMCTGEGCVCIKYERTASSEERGM